MQASWAGVLFTPPRGHAARTSSWPTAEPCCAALAPTPAAAVSAPRFTRTVPATDVPARACCHAFACGESLPLAGIRAGGGCRDLVFHVARWRECAASPLQLWFTGGWSSLKLSAHWFITLFGSQSLQESVPRPFQEIHRQMFLPMIP